MVSVVAVLMRLAVLTQTVMRAVSTKILSVFKKIPYQLIRRGAALNGQLDALSDLWAAVIHRERGKVTLMKAK